MYSLCDVDRVIGDGVQLCPLFPPGFASGLELCVPGAGCVTADERSGQPLHGAIIAFVLLGKCLWVIVDVIS